MTTETTTAKSFDENGFWAMLKRSAKAAGLKVVRMALQAYYVLKSSDTPFWAKSVVIGALVYFVSPLDAIPDAIPIIGYSDDLAVLVAALNRVSAYVTPEVTRKAEDRLREWFG